MRANAVRLRVMSAWFLVALLAGGCSSLASKGTMPPPGPNGVVDASLAPDFIAVAGRDDGIVGYVSRESLFPQPTTTVGMPREPEWPVYGEDLLTLIGHMVPGKGFVPLGVDPRVVPNRPVRQGPSFAAPVGESRSLTLYVRSAATGTAWFAVTPLGDAVGGQGYNNGIGVGCLDVAAGDQLVMVDRPPQDAGSRTLRVIYKAALANETPTLWVDIGATGTVSQGQGVPSWWSGAPQGC